MASNKKGKFVTPEAAAELAVRDGDWVDYGFGAGFPELMDRALAELKSLGCREAVLWVLEENQRARAFYEHCGFLADEGRQELTLGKPVLVVRYRRQIA